MTWTWASSRLADTVAKRCCKFQLRAKALSLALLTVPEFDPFGKWDLISNVRRENGAGVRGLLEVHLASFSSTFSLGGCWPENWEIGKGQRRPAAMVVAENSKV